MKVSLVLVDTLDNSLGYYQGDLVVGETIQIPVLDTGLLTVIECAGKDLYTLPQPIRVNAGDKFNFTVTQP